MTAAALVQFLHFSILELKLLNLILSSEPDNYEILLKVGRLLHARIRAQIELEGLIKAADVDELGRIVLRLRNGLTTDQPMSFNATRKLLGISVSKLNEIERNVYEKLARPCTPTPISFEP